MISNGTLSRRATKFCFSQGPSLTAVCVFSVGCLCIHLSRTWRSTRSSRWVCFCEAFCQHHLRKVNHCWCDKYMILCLFALTNSWTERIFYICSLVWMWSPWNRWLKLAVLAHWRCWAKLDRFGKQARRSFSNTLWIFLHSHIKISVVRFDVSIFVLKTAAERRDFCRVVCSCQS